MQESISAPQVGGIVRMTNFIIKGTLLLELIGAFIMAVQFLPAVWSDKGNLVFHFSLYFSFLQCRFRPDGAALPAFIPP